MQGILGKMNTLSLSSPILPDTCASHYFAGYFLLGNLLLLAPGRLGPHLSSSHPPGLLSTLYPGVLFLCLDTFNMSAYSRFLLQPFPEPLLISCLIICLDLKHPSWHVWFLPVHRRRSAPWCLHEPGERTQTRLPPGQTPPVPANLSLHFHAWSFQSLPPMPLTMCPTCH